LKEAEESEFKFKERDITVFEVVFRDSCIVTYTVGNRETIQMNTCI
jgi:hypothetical protein